MKKIYCVIFNSFIAVNIFLIFVFSQAIYGQNSSQENMEQAKTRLEALYKQWQWFDRNFFEKLDSELLKRIDKSPKGEFETTKQFEDRIARAAKLEEQIKEELLKKNRLEQESLERQMNQIMTMEFDSAFTAGLGTYNADTQKFPISFASGSEEFLFVPISEAKEFKEKAAQSKTFGKFALLLDSNGRAKEYLLSGKIIVNNKSYQLIPKSMNMERAMFLLFGNMEIAKKRSVWQYIRAEETNKEYVEKDSPEVELVIPSKFNPESAYVFYNYKMFAMPVFSKAFQENGLSKFVIVAGSVKDPGDGQEVEFGTDCHGCPINMSIATFVQKNGTWKIEAINRQFCCFGEYGFPPDVSLAKIGKDKYAVVFKDGYYGMGYETSGSFYFGRVDEVIKLILKFTNLSDSSGTGTIGEGSENTKAKVEYLPTTDSEYFNIKVTTTGQKAVKSGKRFFMRPFSEIILYKFIDGSYQSIK